MELKPQHINLGSRIYKEPFTIHWRIKGFNTMPFLDNHPVCGPWFMLGKKRDSTWSLVMTKQVQNGVENVGFKLVRADDDTVWDMATFSLGVKMDDGRFINCIDRKVVGKESNNDSYVFLVCPTTSGSAEMVNKSLRVRDPDTLKSLSESVTIGNVRRDEKSTGVEGSNIENSLGYEGSSGFKGSTHVEKGIGSEESSGVKESANVDYGRSLKGTALNGSTVLKNDRDSERPTGVNGSTNFETSLGSEGSSRLKGSPHVGNGITSEESSRIKESAQVEKGRSSEGSSGFKGSTRVEKGIGSEESSGVKESTNVENGRSLKGPSVVNGSTLGNGRDSKGVTGSTVENGRRSDEPVVGNGLANADNDHNSKGYEAATETGIVENSRSLSKSTIPNTRIEEDKSDIRHLTPEELFQQKNITVVCVIEYTYMMYDPIDDPEESDYSDLIDTFRDLYTSGKFSDITLKCEEVHFLCHKAILCTRSPLFQQFVDREGRPEMVLKIHLDLITAKALLLYVYTGEFDDEIIETDEECEKLCKAAEQFGLPGLRKLCLDFLDEVADEVEGVLVGKSEIKSDRELPLLSISSCDKEAKKTPVDEEIPVTNIGTQTSTSSKLDC